MGFHTPYHRDDTDWLIREINARYQLDVVELTPLGGELDANFKAATSSGELYFARLTSTSLGLDVIRWQNQVLQQLTHRPLSVPAPKLLSQQDGSIMSTLTSNGDEAHLRLTTWVPGATVADLGETSPEFRRHLGVLAAELVDCLSPLNENAPDDHSHHWMVVRSGDSLRATMHEVADPDRKQLLSTALERFDAVADEIPLLPKSVVHQDLHDFNLLAVRSSDGSARLSGVVDFNDAVYTARVAELSITAVYATLRQPNAFECFLQVLEGFLTRAELSEAEIQVLYPLAVARLAVNASTWTARAKAENKAYAEARMAATWPALEQLLRVTPAAAESRIVELVARQHATGAASTASTVRAAHTAR